MSAKKMTLLAACRDFFGLFPGQQGMGFMKEYKALSEQDKAEIKAGLEKQGYEIMASVPGPQMTGNPVPA
jgi:hypothetical protein